MNCTFPPALSDAQLLTFIDGEASREISTHLARCPSCQERMQVLARLQKRLSAQLFRVTCPPSLELGEYQAGLLDAKQAQVIQQHLATCPHCTRELHELQGYLEQLPPVFATDHWKQFKTQTRLLVAHLVDTFASLGGPTSVPVGIRGEQDAPLIYEADDIQIIVETQVDATQANRRVMLGLLLGFEPVHGVLARLWQTEELLATTPVDELGNFVFSNLLPGSYGLIVSGEELELHIKELPVA